MTFRLLFADCMQDWVADPSFDLSHNEELGIRRKYDGYVASGTNHMQTVDGSGPDVKGVRFLDSLQGMYRNLPDTQLFLFTCWYSQVLSAYPAIEHVLVWLKDSAGNDQVCLAVDANGGFALYRGGGPGVGALLGRSQAGIAPLGPFVNKVVVDLGVWSDSSGSGQAFVRVNGEPLIEFAGNTRGGSAGPYVGRVQFGNSGTAGTSLDDRLYDIVCYTTASGVTTGIQSEFIGQPLVRQFLFQADGTYHDFLHTDDTGLNYEAGPPWYTHVRNGIRGSSYWVNQGIVGQKGTVKLNIFLLGTFLSTQLYMNFRADAPGYQVSPIVRSNTVDALGPGSGALPYQIDPLHASPSVWQAHLFVMDTNPTTGLPWSGVFGDPTALYLAEIGIQVTSAGAWTPDPPGVWVPKNGLVIDTLNLEVVTASPFQPTLVLIEGADHYTSPSKKWDQVPTGAAAPDILPSVGRAHTSALHLPRDDSYVRKFAPVRSGYFTGFAWRTSLGALPGGFNHCLVAYEDGSNRLQLGLFVTSDGAIQVRRGVSGTNASTLLASSLAGTLTAGGKHKYVHWYAIIGNGYGRYRVLLDGADLLEGSALNTQGQPTTNVAAVRFGGCDDLSIATGITCDDLVDDIFILDVTNGFDADYYSKKLHVVTLVPTGPGFYADLTPTPAPNWAAVDEIPPVTADFVKATTFDLIDTYVMSDLPSFVTTPKAVQPLPYAQIGASGDNPFEFAPYMRRAGVDGQFPHGSVPGVGVYSYIGQFKGSLFDLTASLTPWSVASVNASEFGVKVVNGPDTTVDGLYMSQFVVEVLCIGLPAEGERRPVQWLHTPH